MQNNVLRMALGIYEQEILFFGGTVTYTGKVLKKGLFSVIEEADITLEETKCTVPMERYRDGSSIVYDSRKGLGSLGCYNVGYGAFYERFCDMSQNSAKHLSFYFFRRMKIFLRALLQLCSLICIIISIGCMIGNGISPVLIVWSVCSLVLFLLIHGSYSYVRVEDIFTHSSILLTHKCEDGSDDFWNS